VRANASDGKAPVDDVMLPVLDKEELNREAQWLGRTIANWLDDDWCPQQCHQDIGAALSAAYLKQREAGKHEATSILLQLSTDLGPVDFSEAFVNPYDIANKALECLLFKNGIACTCQSPQDQKFLEDSLKDI